MPLEPPDIPYGVKRGNHKLRVGLARRHGIVPLDVAAWLGGSATVAEKSKFHRHLAAMESAGLIERLRLHGAQRFNHVRLTEKGLAEARALANVRQR
ncbi:MAG: winged helix-turn-helix transcriptional regulator [Planctomycetia bacterium]|nr:winged helix-turn-helix transcriptional regulator [Planctomycetia bacterium]